MAAATPAGKAAAAKSKALATVQEIIAESPGIKQADLLTEASTRGVSNKKVLKILSAEDAGSWLSCRVGARGLKKYWFIEDAPEEDEGEE
jgi:hypothetical protein